MSRASRWRGTRLKPRPGRAVRGGGVWRLASASVALRGSAPVDAGTWLQPRLGRVSPGRFCRSCGVGRAAAELPAAVWEAEGALREPRPFDRGYEGVP